MIRVITIEREYGSGGADIAASVAERLGWKLWNQLLTNQIARLMDCDCRTSRSTKRSATPLSIGSSTLHARQPTKEV